MEYRRLLSNRNYVLLQSANFINRLGDSIDAIALSWLVYQISNSASVAAVNYALNYVPTVLLQPIVGAYVVRKDKKKVMVIADVARGIIVAFLASMVLSGKANSTIVIICTFSMSCFETLRVPSGNAIIPLIIAKEDYKIAASFSSSLSRTVELIGTGIAGVIVAVLGIYAAIFLDAASFFLSAICLCFMKIKEHIFTAEKADCLMNDFKAGLSYVLKNKALFYCCLIASACNMLLVPMNALQSAFITTYYHGDASYLSLMGIALSLGSLLGASVYPVISNHCKNKTLIIIIFPACSFLYLSQLILGFTDSQLSIMIGIAIIYFLTGLFVGVASCHISVMVMLKTKQEYLSRVSSLLNAASNGLIPVTSFTISALAAFFTPDTLFLISGIIILLFSVGSYMSRRLEVLND